MCPWHNMPSASTRRTEDELPPNYTLADPQSHGAGQAGLGSHVAARFFECTRCRPGHLGHLQVFDHNDRVALADQSRVLVQEIMTVVGHLATPDTLMRWYKRLVAQKFDGSQKRNKLGGPRISNEIEALVLQMANDNPTWGYHRIQGALANLGHHIDKITVRKC